MKDVLAINSYAGSLVLGATKAGYKLRGSYEDAGYGIAAQKLNFPDLNFVDKSPWPEDDLSETAVIAHPPCASFSIMNPMKGSAKHTGETADGFQCHRNVMNYALGKGCESLAIESVTGVMKAQATYQEFGEKYGYHVYFLRLNAIGFGVPQWRPRVWILFLKKVEGRTNLLHVKYEPSYVKLESVLQTTGTTMAGGDETHIMVRRLKEAKISGEELRKIFTGEYGCGSLLQIGQEVLGIDDVGENFAEVRKAWNLGGLYSAMMPRILDPNLWAPTVLGGSAWFVNGRPLFLEEYMGIMGFPTDYKWPQSFSDPRLYLSKGVCPPIAGWILQQLERNQEGALDFTHTAEPGEVIDLQPKKAHVSDFLLQGKLWEDEPGRPRKARAPRAEAAGRTYAAPVVKSAADLTKSFLDSFGTEEGN